MKSQPLKSVFMVVALASTPLAFAGEKPPANAKPLSQVIKMLEDKGYNPIVDVEIDNAVWEIEAYKNAQKRELKVDPVKATIISDRPDH